jgi:hypothetical protein
LAAFDIVLPHTCYQLLYTCYTRNTCYTHDIHVLINFICIE